MTDVLIYSDGSSRGNPGPGGWGAIVANDEHVREFGGGENNTTNNRMELKGAIEALRSVQEADSIVMRTDSSYVLKGATTWIHGWRRNGWMTAKKERVLNEDLWQELGEIVDALGKILKWENVGGHVGVPGNERADVIATAFADGKHVALYNGPRSKYPVDLTSVAKNSALQNQKSHSRARQKAKAYSYVSEVGGEVLVHKTWLECSSRVRGKRARFKKSISPEDEQDIVREFSV